MARNKYIERYIQVLEARKGEIVSESVTSVTKPPNTQAAGTPTPFEELPFPKLCSATEKELFARANTKYLARQEFQRGGQMVDTDAVLQKWYTNAASAPFGLDISNMAGGLTKLVAQVSNFFSEYKNFRSFLQVLPTPR